jgi:methyl-accepting chemotaxis protein
MDELNTLRAKGTKILTGVCVLYVATLLALALLGTGTWIVVLIGAAASILPIYVHLNGRTDSSARMILGLTIPVFPALSLMDYAGAAWMIDIHMTFFALIALTAMLADWRPVVAAGAVTAVHHLLLNFIFPGYVFPDGADIGRVLFHAFVVVVEVAGLVFLTNQLEGLFLAQENAHLERERIQAEAMAERERLARDARAEQDRLEAEAAAERADRESEQRQIIAALAVGLEALSSGDLAYQITDQFPQSYESLRRHFNQAARELDEAIESVDQAAREISVSTSEIRTASDDLATRTERQAASLEQTAASLNMVTAVVGETAKNAGELNDSISVAQKGAVAGGAVVRRAIDAMELIQRSAGEISKIVTIIDGIAFQTNLLALNAGVEAARAGESGKGFAVVANEVRALAQRSAEAAKDIKELIETSVGQVGEGVDLVDETGKMLETIVEQVTSFGVTVETIANNSMRQAEDLQQVNTTIAEVEHSTQQNAAMVEESTAALRTLSQEAEQMVAAVEHFRRDRDPDQGVATSRNRRAA